MSTFDVSWSSGNKALGGKVFAKRRKAPKTTEKSIQPVVNQTPKSVANDVEKADKPQNFKITNKLERKTFVENPNKTDKKIPFKNFKSFDIASEISTKLVKRKKNKDKLAIKLADQTGSTTEIQNSTKTPNKHSLFSVGSKNIYVKPNLRGKPVIEKVFSAGKKFSDLDIHKYIVSNLEKIGFTTLTTVQEKSVPVVLSRDNVLVSTFFVFV